jgi:hypothetical protein
VGGKVLRIGREIPKNKGLCIPLIKGLIAGF